MSPPALRHHAMLCALPYHDERSGLPSIAKINTITTSKINTCAGMHYQAVGALWFSAVSRLSAVWFVPTQRSIGPCIWPKSAHPFITREIFFRRHVICTCLRRFYHHLYTATGIGYGSQNFFLMFSYVLGPMVLQASCQNTKHLHLESPRTSPSCLDGERGN